MEIKFKSEIFKKIFDSEVFTDEMAENKALSIYKDLNPWTFLDKEFLEDYEMVLANSSNLETITFSGVSADVIKMFLGKGIKGKTLEISNTKLTSRIFIDADENGLENIEELCITGCTSSEDEKTQILSANKFKNLRSINFINSEGLDVNDFLSKLPEKEKVEKITLSEPLPNPNIIKSFTGIKKLEIFNVKNSEELKNFLEAIQLETIEDLKIGNCNCEALPEELSTRLKVVKKIEFYHNSNIEYENFLENLDSKDLVHLEIGGIIDEKKQFDVAKFKKFNLNYLHLSNWELDFEELKYVLKNNGSLLEFRLHNCGVENLEFLTDSDILKIIISQKEMDFSILTTELAQKLKNITLRKDSTEESVQTTTVNFGNDLIPFYTSLTLNVNDTSLEQVEHLAECKGELKDTNIRLTTKDTTRIRDFVSIYGHKMDFGYVLDISDFSMLNRSGVEELNKEKRIQHIRAMDVTCNDKMSTERFSYTPEQFLELKEIVESITKGIEPDMPELEKFMIIYRRLGSLIKYDFGIIGKNQYSQYAKDNVDNCRNMINGLTRHTCVCAGYADILYNCLREVGLESYKITGTSGTEWHQWNKVKIDGVLYNVDLTWDAENLAENCLINLKNCLVSDTFFEITHKRVFGNDEKCTKSISAKDKREALKKALEFDGIEPKSLMKKAFEELKELNIREEIKKYFETLKKGWIEEVLPELRAMFSRKKALPEPGEGEKHQEDAQVDNPSAKTSNPWELGTDYKDKVNEVSHTNSENGQTVDIDKEVYDE